MPKHFSDNKKCQHCAARFAGPIASRYCGDKCHIKAASVVTADGCWEWQRKRNKKTGRAQINPRKGFHTSAARVSYEAFKGEIPASMMVCHKCDNPGCVNPACLFLGSNADNMADMTAKRRQCRGEATPWVKLDVPAVREIRESQASNATLARRFGVNAKTIATARTGKTWSHVQ